MTARRTERRKRDVFLYVLDFGCAFLFSPLELLLFTFENFPHKHATSLGEFFGLKLPTHTDGVAVAVAAAAAAAASLLLLLLLLMLILLLVLLLLATATAAFSDLSAFSLNSQYFISCLNISSEYRMAATDLTRLEQTSSALNQLQLNTETNVMSTNRFKLS